MRRGLLVVGLISVVAVIAWFVSRPGPTPPTPGPTAPVAPQVTSKWEATIAPRGERSLTGRVTFKGEGVANAQVVAVAANAGEPLLTERPCTCELKCGKPMLSCDRGARSPDVEEWLATRSGEAVPVGRATTDADGRFSLSGLGDEVVTLWAESDGAKQVGSLGSVTSGADVTVELKPSRTLEGVVRRGDKPVAAALVTAVEAHLPRFFDAVTRADGTFTLSGVPEGSWVVFASEGDARALRSVFARDYLPIELDLLSPRQVKGRVVLGSNDQPVPDVEVELGGVTPRLTRTDATGTFVFDGVRAQVVELSVSDARGVGSAGVNLDDGEPIVVRLLRGRTVRGRVVEEDGRPVANAVMEVRDTVQAKPVTTGPDGRFEVQRVSVGPVSVNVITDGYLPEYETFTADEVTLTLRRAAMLRGRVVRPGKGMLFVSARRSDGNAREADDTSGWFDSKEVVDGGFALSLVPGRYQVSVSGEGVLPQAREVRAPADEVVFELSGGARLEGHVTNAKGEPEPGARLTARRDDDTQFTETNQRGEFELGGLPSGEVIVSVMAGTGEWTLEKKVTLRDAETTRADFSPDPGAPLAGVVVDSLGAPVPDVSVRATCVEDESQSVSARSDAQGAFRLLGLPAGPVRLVAYAEGRTLTLDTTAPNESLTLRLALKTEVVGRVVDSSGRPITSFLVHGMPVESPDGRFQQLAYAEQSHLFVEAKGYVLRKIQVTLKEGKNDLGDLVLTTGRTLKGRVVDGESGEPIAGAFVRQEGNPRGSSASTHLDGRFELTLDPDGKGLRFEHRDYQPRTGPAPEQSPCEVALSRGLTLSVRVFDAAGKQLRSVGVRAKKGDEARVLSPVNGVFSSGGFAPGTWTVVVSSASSRVWRPLQVELTQGSVVVDVREATDGVSFKVDVPDARFIALVPGEVTIGTYKDLTQQTAVLEVVEGVVTRVTPGAWTVLAVRSPNDEKTRGLLLSRTVIQVLAEGSPDVVVTPDWKLLELPHDE